MEHFFFRVNKTYMLAESPKKWTKETNFFQFHTDLMSDFFLVLLNRYQEVFLLITSLHVTLERVNIIHAFCLFAKITILQGVNIKQDQT